MRTSWPLGRHLASFYSGIYTPQACLLEQKTRDDAVDDAQHRREQFGVRRDEDASGWGTPAHRPQPRQALEWQQQKSC